jgi:Cullin family
MLFDYYMEESNRLSLLPLLEYIDQVQKLFQFEMDFCMALHPESWPRIQNELKYILVAKYFPTLQEQSSVIQRLFQAEDFKTVTIVHNFTLMEPDVCLNRKFLPSERIEWSNEQEDAEAQKNKLLVSRLSSDRVVMEEMRKYMEGLGLQLCHFEESADPRHQEQIPHIYSERVLSLQNRTDDLIATVLDSNPNCAQYRASAFNYFLERFEKSKLFLNIHLDKYMRSRDLTEQALTEGITQICRVFGYLSAKDTFLHEMTKRLSPRLLYGDVYIENEKLLLRQLLKQISQTEHTNRQTCMVNDMMLQEDLNKNFTSPTTLQFSVKIISQDIWPLEIHSFKPNHSHCPILDTLLTSYSKHYTHVYQDRMLEWLPTEGRCEVYYTLKDKKIILLTTL